MSATLSNITALCESVGKIFCTNLLQPGPEFDLEARALNRKISSSAQVQALVCLALLQNALINQQPVGFALATLPVVRATFKNLPSTNHQL